MSNLLDMNQSGISQNILFTSVCFSVSAQEHILYYSSWLLQKSISLQRSLARKPSVSVPEDLALSADILSRRHVEELCMLSFMLMFSQVICIVISPLDIFSSFALIAITNCKICPDHGHFDGVSSVGILLFSYLFNFSCMCK